jgi:nucleoside-diphosphate-sugar epimerase
MANQTGSQALPPGRIVVLGGTGLIGRHVVEALAAAGARDLVATYRSRPAFEGWGAQWQKADLLDPADARAALSEASAAIVCAGKVSTSAELRRDPVGSVLATLRIGINALEAAAAERVDRLILVSSCTGYPEGASLKEEAGMFHADPPSGWFGVGWSHRFLEKQLEWYASHLGMIASAVALRPTLVYGPHDDFSRESGHFVPSMVGQVVSRQRPIEVWGDGSQTRNLIHAADVASAVVAALGAPPGYAAYNIASARSVSVNEVLKALIEADGFSDAEIVHLRDRPSGASALQVSAAAFSGQFGWQPACALQQGLAGTLQWYRRNGLSAR